MAPDFRLAAAAGGEIALSDYRGRKSLLLWFSKGLFCPFCRRNMARLGQAYPRFQNAGAVILQVTLNTIEEAKVYFQNYSLPTPYLCDDQRQVHSRYGVEPMQLEVGALVENVAASITASVGDFLLRGEKSPLPVSGIMRMGPRNQISQLVVIVDWDGVVRHVQSVGHSDTLPTADELLARLAPLQPAT